jgi:hypothetical protein
MSSSGYFNLYPYFAPALAPFLSCGAPFGNFGDFDGDDCPYNDNRTDNPYCRSTTPLCYEPETCEIPCHCASCLTAYGTAYPTATPSCPFRSLGGPLGPLGSLGGPLGGPLGPLGSLGGPLGGPLGPLGSLGGPLGGPLGPF